MNFIQFFKFGFVGFIGLIVDFGVTWVAKEVLKVNKYLANSLGFVIAVTNNFVLNRLFTFENSDPNLTWQFASFLVIAIIGLALSTSLIYVLINKVKLGFYPSKALATVIVFLWNFLANSHYTFN